MRTTKPCRRDRLRDDRGAALVEFALIAPFLFSLALFLITGALAMDRKLSVAHSVREGARYGATVPLTQTFASGSWASNVRDVVVARSNGELDNSTVCVSLVEGVNPTVRSTPQPATWFTTNSDGSPCAPSDTYPAYNPPSDDGLRVQVVATASADLEAVAFSRTVVFDLSAVAKSETAS